MYEPYNQKSTRIYNWIFWVSMSVITVWVVLKAVGIINTPEWQQLLPVAGAIFAGGAFFQKINSMETKFNIMERRFGSMESDNHGIKVDIAILKNDIGIVKNKLSI